MPGWEYDEGYKKALSMPSTWDEVGTANSNWQAAGNDDKNTWNISENASSSNGLLASPTRNGPNPRFVPNPQQLRSTGFHSLQGRGNHNNHSTVGLNDYANHNTKGYTDYATLNAKEHNDYANHNPSSWRSPRGEYDCRNASDMLGSRANVRGLGGRLSNLSINNVVDQNMRARKDIGLIADERGLGKGVPRKADHDIGEKAMKGNGINFDAYEEIPVEASGEGVPHAVETFAEMDCGVVVNDNIRRCGFERPTPVQRHAMPICMGGRDLMACAQTGSGKTAAFCVPIIACILRNRLHERRPLPHHAPTIAQSCSFPLALILSPTRELTCQTYTEAKKFAHETRLRVVVVYGGTPVRAQLKELDRGVDILIATPGRLGDLMDRGKISLSQVKHLVIDEADRMLDMGFEPQIRRIVEAADMPAAGKRQTMLFSATFPHEIQKLAGDFLSNYIFLSVGRVGSSTDLIVQKMEYLYESEKRNKLMELIQAHGFEGTEEKRLIVVFVETKRGADALEDWLCGMGWHATSIHGDRNQEEREYALRSFRSGNTPILVATDVAARGLDIPDVVHVINYDLPNDIDSYVHRIGRTGRAGRMGTATGFFTDKNISLAKPLVELMEESNQEVPQWLVEYAAAESHGQGGGRTSRSRGASRFGGKRW